MMQKNYLSFIAFLLILIIGNAQTPFDTLFPIRTENVYFDFGKADIRTDATATLRQLVQELPDSFKIAIRITAHTDAVGNPEANQKLSDARANAVLNALAEMGFSDSIFTVRGFGETNPVANNTTDEGRQLNRRATVEVVRRIRMITVGGKVVNPTTGKGIEAEVVVHNRVFRDTMQTDTSGDFRIAVPAGEIFGVDVFAEGYFFETQLNKAVVGELKKLEIPLKPVEIGASIDLKNLYFVGNEDILLKPSEPELPKLLKFMRFNPLITIEIGGHINRPNEPPVSENSWDFDLSVRRAKRVHDYLLENGIEPIRIQYKGYGNSQMRFPKARQEREASQNRRVEIKVVGMGK